MNPTEYETMYRQETGHWWYRGLRGMIDLAISRAELPAAWRLLDVGCGTGANGVHLRERGDVTALDVSHLAIAKCRARGLARLVQASASDLPIADGQFDMVMLMDVLYHRDVSDPRRPLEEARRVLKPSGYVVLNAPAYQWLYSHHDTAVHTARRFTRRQVRGLLAETGFAPVFLTYWNTLLFPAIVTARKLQNGHTESSDTERRYSPRIEGAFGSALAMERAVIPRCRLPFGVSIFGLARKVEP